MYPGACTQSVYPAACICGVLLAVTSQSGSLDNLLQAASDLGQQFCVSVSLIQIFSFINERSALSDHKKLLKFRIPELQNAGLC